MHGMKNVSSMGLLWLRQWYSQIRKRRIIHSNSDWHGLFYSGRRDILTQVLMKIMPFRLAKGFGHFGGK